MLNIFNPFIISMNNDRIMSLRHKNRYKRLFTLINFNYNTSELGVEFRRFQNIMEEIDYDIKTINLNLI